MKKLVVHRNLATTKHLTVLPPLSLTSLYPPMQCFPPDLPPGNRSCHSAFLLLQTLAHGSSGWKAWPRTQPAALRNLAGEPSQVHFVAAPVDQAWCKRLRRRKVCVEHQWDLLLLTLRGVVGHCHCHSLHQQWLEDSTLKRRSPDQWSLVLGRRAYSPLWRRCSQFLVRPSLQTRAGSWSNGFLRCGKTPSLARLRSCTGPSSGTGHEQML